MVSSHLSPFMTILLICQLPQFLWSYSWVGWVPLPKSEPWVIIGAEPIMVWIPSLVTKQPHITEGLCL